MILFIIMGEYGSLGITNNVDMKEGWQDYTVYIHQGIGVMTLHRILTTYMATLLDLITHPSSSISTLGKEKEGHPPLSGVSFT